MKLLVIICSIQFAHLQSIAGEEHSNGTVHASAKIAGGRYATEGEFPYMCSVQVKQKHICGCVIISSEWVLTASQCLRSATKAIEIVVGTVNFQSGGGTRYQIQVSIPHQQFQENVKEQPKFVNDIGLCYIKGSIQFGEKVKAIELTTDYVLANKPLVSMGWGRVAEGGEFPKRLKVLKLTSNTNTNCQNAFGYTYHIHDSHLCGKPAPNEGICSKEDYGGPLVYNNQLAGIASYSVQCGRGHHDVFVRISEVYDWVERTKGTCSQEGVHNKNVQPNVYKSVASALTAFSHNPLFYIFVLGIHIISLGVLKIKF